MSVIGLFVKTKFPSVYQRLTRVINLVIAASKPYSIYITDNLGGSFKSYMLSHNMLAQLTVLKNDLDPESIEVVDVILQRLIFYPDEKFKKKISRKRPVVGGLLSVERPDYRDKVDKKLRLLRETIKLPKTSVEESVFYYYHGLSLLPIGIIKYIKGQHFIDLGAYDGDSAIALSAYNYSKIFSFEISKKSIQRYIHNMKLNHIEEEKYEILNIGIAASDDVLPIRMPDTGSAGFSIYRHAGKYDEIQIEMKTLDSIVEKLHIRPKFIKADIEGAAMDFVRGSIKTLAQFRPIISVAIYHNPIEFFEVKPELEDILPNYTFMIRKLASGIKNNLSHSEVVLLAYPSELETK